MLALFAALLPFFPAPVSAQQSRLERDRAEFTAWLASAPTTPTRAVAHRRIEAGLSLGANDSDITLPDLPPGRVTAVGGAARLEQPGGTRPLPRGGSGAVAGPYRLQVRGMPGRMSLTVFGPTPLPVGARWFPVAAGAVDTVTLGGPRGARVLLLAPDGTDVEAVEAGQVTVRRFGAPVVLTVREFPGASEDERELEIYFRDATNGYGSYPAGRYVTLAPIGGGRYVVDFNTARNPWCAYNTVFPCPPPWPGNSIAVRVAAGEQYESAGP